MVSKKDHVGSRPTVRTKLPRRWMTASIATKTIVEELLRSGIHDTMAAASRASGLDYKTFRAIAQQLGLWAPNQGRKGVFGRPLENFNRSIPLADILAGWHPQYGTSKLKKRLVADNVLPDMCAVCGTGPTWNGSPLTLQLDHINGNSSDHRLVNLRIICPNCHSQTVTFAGRGKTGIPVRLHAFQEVQSKVVQHLMEGECIRQALLKAGLSDAKYYYEAVQLLAATSPEVANCKAFERYRPNRTPKTKRSPAEYRHAQHQLWLAAQAERLAKLQAADIDFQRLGWATQVARLLDMPPQKVVPWIRKVDPEFLNKCKLRTPRA